jgi:gliding motility-associated-like protein
MILYISSKQDAIVTVDIPGIGYSQTYNVTANVALATNPIPKAGLQDARLNSTGVLNRGIHVSSNGVPFALWGHIYASQSSGATMVLPTNTWGTDYTVLTTGGTTNSGVPHSFFFVQASENNTVIDITPSADITAIANGTTILYPAGVQFAITLNQGEVFNALGKLNSSSNGVDLTGTKVKARDCKKIALFTGNGRVQLTVGGCSPSNGGSDNFIQQMFPKATWGSKYLAIPFRSMEAGFYRVVVSDPATIVKLNGVAIPATSLVNNFYYQIETDTTNLIESDKPVMVAQYCATNSCNGTGMPDHPSTGNTGDPEMIILSPTSQAINDVSVFSATQYSIQHNYINVIIKNAGVASFQLDGVNVSAQFIVHQKDPNYSYAVFADIAGGVSHRLTSNEGFNAIAYGFSSSSNNESYGYNAGTNLKDLSTAMLINNPFAVSGNATTCKNNPIKFRIAIPVAPANINSLTWSFNNNPNLTPNTPVTQNSPLTYDSTFVVDGATLYAYSLGTYTFNTAGTYPIKVVGNLLTADGCTGLKEYNFNVVVVEGVKPNFTGNLNVCLGDTVRLSDASNGQGTTVNAWRWDWTDGSPIETTQNVKHKYLAAGTYNVKLRAINTIGCYADTVKAVSVFAPPIANFKILDTACVGQNIRFDDLSTIPIGTITKWTWNFGDGSPVVIATTNTQQLHSYATPGIYTVTLIVESNIGCISVIASKQIPVYKTTADFTFLPSPTCIGSAVQFTDASTGGGATVNGWLWNFGNTTTSTLQTPLLVTYSTAGIFNISLQATSNKGCIGTVTKPITVAPLLNAPVITVTDSTFTSVTFSWNAITGAAGYQVSVNGGLFITPSSGTTGITHTVTGLAANQTVCVVVRVNGVVSCQTNTSVSVCGKTLLPSLEIFLPNTFTPNGDGKNDIFKIYGNHLLTVRLMIFNQWGEKVFETTDVNGGWDGTYKGKQQPAGVYMYVASATTLDGKSYNKRGSINLIR